MAINGHTDTAVLVALLSERAAVNVRLALVADEQHWQLHHGQVTLEGPPKIRIGPSTVNCLHLLPVSNS
jgi:hypothetical protein